MSNYTELRVEVEEAIATITFARPERLNTFTSTMASELMSALTEAEADEQVRVVVLAADGRSFCAGIDLREFNSLKGPGDYRKWVEHMERPLLYISRMSKPVIAQVQGAAAANGAGLVAASDMAIASTKARIGFTAVNVGLFCLGPAVPLSRVVGRKRALELLLMGRLITAQQALEMGLVNAVVEPDQLEQEVRAWARELAEKSPVAVGMGKRAYYIMEQMGYEQGFEFMNEVFARLCCSEDAAEGIEAFKQKRRPCWKGR